MPNLLRIVKDEDLSYNIPKMKNWTLGTVSAKIMDFIWQKEASRIGDVKAGLKERFAYTTIATLVGRLLQRGFLERKHKGQGYIYNSALSKDEFFKHQSQVALNDLFKKNKSAGLIISQFVDNLEKADPQKLKELQKLIQKKLKP